MTSKFCPQITINLPMAEEDKILFIDNLTIFQEIRLLWFYTYTYICDVYVKYIIYNKTEICAWAASVCKMLVLHVLSSQISQILSVHLTNSSHTMFIKAWLVGLTFTFLEHLRSYQDGYRLVKLWAHDDFIVLPYWEIRSLTSWPDIPLNHITLTLSLLILALSY